LYNCIIFDTDLFKIKLDIVTQMYCRAIESQGSILIRQQITFYEDSNEILNIINDENKMSYGQRALSSKFEQ